MLKSKSDPTKPYSYGLNSLVRNAKGQLEKFEV
jgi:hypothetical protein